MADMSQAKIEEWGRRFDRVWQLTGGTPGGGTTDIQLAKYKPATHFTELNRERLEPFLAAAYAHVNPEREDACDKHSRYAHRIKEYEPSIEVQQKNMRFTGMNQTGQATFAFALSTMDGAPLGDRHIAEPPMRVLAHLAFANSSAYHYRQAEYRFIRNAHYQAARHMVRTGVFDWEKS